MVVACCLFGNELSFLLSECLFQQSIDYRKVFVPAQLKGYFTWMFDVCFFWFQIISVTSLILLVLMSQSCSNLHTWGCMASGTRQLEREGSLVHGLQNWQRKGMYLFNSICVSLFLGGFDGVVVLSFILKYILSLIAYIYSRNCIFKK